MKKRFVKPKLWCYMVGCLLLLGITPCAKASNNKTVEISANERKIEGTIVDAGGEPIIGASISVKNSTVGTISDLDGKFNLSAPDNSVLLVSYIGYIPQEIKIGSKNTFEITLLEDNKVLDEIVVVGFGSQKKVNLTGAVANVDSKAFENRAVTNASQALQGVMPGLNISQNKGFLDQSPSINIRGTGSIDKGSSASPLILIDGIESDLNRLNPQDIESVSVLKDAAASSIYGSRAPFGVILITTKKGKEGRVTASYNTSLRWQSPINMPKVVDSYTFANYFNETATNGGTTGHFSPERLQKIKDFQAGKITGGIDPDPNNPTQWLDLFDHGYANTDWFDVMFKDQAFSQEHNVSLTGGSEKIQVYASANYMGQNGFMKLNPEKNERIATNLRITTQLNKYISLGYNIKYNNTRFVKPTLLADNIFNRMTRQGWPTLPSHDPNGYLYAYATLALGIRDAGETTTKANEAVHAFNITIEPIKGWKIMGDMNYKQYNERKHSVLQKIYNHDVNEELVWYKADGTNTSINEAYLGSKYLNANLYSQYENGWMGHNIKVMGGFQSEKFSEDVFGAGRLGIIVPGINTIDTTSGTDGDGKVTPPSVNGKLNKWATVGFFGRLNYDYKERYLMEMNIRYDGTSRFRKDQRWKFFPSFSLGWNVARESFFEPMNYLVSTLKVRASYGKLGNQNTKIWYPTYLTMPIGTANGSWLVNGNKPNSADAPGLISTTMGWETVRTLNFGLDVNMLDNRLGLSFDAFKRNTNDMIGPAPEMPVILGTAVPKTNNTDLKTQGWELNVSWRDALKCGLGYNVAFNIADSRTTITNYPNEIGTVTEYYSNKKMGEIWGYETLGIAKSDQEMEQHMATLPNGGQNAMGNNWAAGDIMYKDLNNDGKIDWGDSTFDNLGDMKVIGNTSPRYAFGVSLGGDYKGFDLSLFFQGIKKRDFSITEQQDFWGAGGGLWDSTCLDEHLDYFRSDSDHPLGQNLNSYYPRPLWSGKNKHAQTRYIIDASYIRLKNMTVGYTIPTAITHKWKIDRLRVSLTGENLWTGTKVPSMYDPETIDSDKGRITYPLSKVISIGVSATF